MVCVRPGRAACRSPNDERDLASYGRDESWLRVPAYLHLLGKQRPTPQVAGAGIRRPRIDADDLQIVFEASVKA